MAKDVSLGVKLGRLGYAFECGDLGKYHSQQAGTFEQLNSAIRVCPTEHTVEFLKYAFGRDAGNSLCVGDNRIPRSLLDIESESSREPYGTQQSQIILHEPFLWVADRTNEPARQIVSAAHEIEHFPRERVVEHAVDREIPTPCVSPLIREHNRLWVTAVPDPNVASKGRDLVPDPVFDHDNDTEVRTDPGCTLEKTHDRGGACVGSDIDVTRRADTEELVAHVASGIERAIPLANQPLHDRACPSLQLPRVRFGFVPHSREKIRSGDGVKTPQVYAGSACPALGRGTSYFPRFERCHNRMHGKGRMASRLEPVTRQNKAPRLQSSSAAPAARPFLKWAGGKSQLISQFEPRFPAGLREGDLRTYVEPFVGAGAVFFHVARTCPIRRAFLYDINEELCLVYDVVKRAVDALIDELVRVQEQYRRLREPGREQLYYRIRERFNAMKSGFDYERMNDAAIERAAQVLFLNRTCYNGLFRTNSSGGFNTPFGRYKNPTIVDPDNLRSASMLLHSASICRGDFEDCARHIDSSTFVYLDPPYRPLSATSHFTSYSRGGFDDAEQERLGRFYSRLDREHRAKLMLSNSDPANTNRNDRFFHRLYHGYRIECVRATRMINSKANGRGAVRELLIMNY